MAAAGVAATLGAFAEAKVQFVVVGDPAAPGPLRLVVSSHPTNLDAVGRVLDRLGATLRDPLPRSGGGVRRIADPLGVVAVATPVGDLDLVVGGPGGTLYSQTAGMAQLRDIGGHQVAWVPEAAAPRPSRRPTGADVSRRLLRLAEGLSRAVEPPADGPSAEAAGDGDARDEADAGDGGGLAGGRGP